MAVNGTHGFWEKKKNTHTHRQNQIKLCGPWRYIKVQRQNDQSVQETEPYFYCFFYLWSTNCPECIHNSWCVVVFLLYGRSQAYKCITATYLSNGPLTSIYNLQVSMYCHESQGLIWFCLCICFFLSLKALSPINYHYITDRLQWVELENFFCVP